jgi:hypothetical protein
VKRLVLAASLFAALWAPARPASLDDAQHRALGAYLSALSRADFAAAYGMLAPADQRYFRNVSNFASVFRADHFALRSFTIEPAAVSAPQGAVASVQEKIDVMDPVHQTLVTLSIPAHYGIVLDGGVYKIRDYRHPWKSFVPRNATVSAGKLSVTVRKVSFYGDRIEVIATFVNGTDAAATFFPYGRSVIHDESNRVYAAVDSRVAARLDNDLYLGLRLPSSAQYTGVVAFRLADPAAPPARLDITISPVVKEGGDAPLELAVPSIDVPV